MSGWNEIFKTYGFTGNVVVDSFILTTLTPLFFSYLTNLTSIFTKFLSTLWNFIVEHIAEKLRIKIFGNKIATMRIDHTNDLYNFI